MCKKVFFTVKFDLFKVHLAIHRATVPAPYGWLRSSERWCQIIFEPQSLLLLLLDIGNQLLHGVAGVLYFTSRLAP